MIQNRTKILIKDNSGVLMGRCINAGKQGGSLQLAKIAILKSKTTFTTKQLYVLMAIKVYVFQKMEHNCNSDLKELIPQ